MDQEQNETNAGRATYTPEDDKLRLYVGRVPRDEYLKLRAEGWVSTPKQNCNFVAPWTPRRRDTALEYAGVIEDEDQSPQDRAADRAERFGDYRDKRTAEAVGHADNFDAGPQAHGYQSQARAERAASRHDRVAGRAGDAWSKAEYWQQRTAGVISHALYVSTPAVRMGRIKTIEADLRRHVAAVEKARETFKMWTTVSEMPDATKQNELAKMLADYEHGNYLHPVTGKEMSLYRIAEDCTGAQVAALWLARHKEPREDNDWSLHYKLRLAYENQMLEAQGGRAAFVEMVFGGWLGSYQIRKVNKSNATGRVVSVQVLAPSKFSDKLVLRTVNIERLKVDAYRAPTAEEVATLQSVVDAEKAAAPKAPPCPLINPTDADAERIQAIWNERAKALHCESHQRRYGQDYADEFKASTVCRITQAAYSANSKGGYARAETRGLSRNAELADRESNMYSRHESERAKRIGPAVCQLRITSGDGSDYGAKRVIVLTDKSQKPLPAAVWETAAPVVPMAIVQP